MRSSVWELLPNVTHQHAVRAVSLLPVQGPQTCHQGRAAVVHTSERAAEVLADTVMRPSAGWRDACGAAGRNEALLRSEMFLHSVQLVGIGGRST